MSIILKISKYLLLSAAVIAVVAVVFVETGYFKGLLRNILTSQLEPLTGGSFTVEKIRGNVFTGVVLEGVRLAGTGGQLFYSEKIDASYSLPALLAHRLYFTNIVISKPFFTIAQNADGRWSYEGLFPASKTRKESGASLSLVLGEIRINDGSVSMKYRNKPPNFDLTGCDLSFSAAINGDTADIEINALSAKSARPSIAIKDMSGSMRLKGPDLNIKGLRVSTEYSKASINGTIINMACPVFNLNIDCPEGSLKDISALVPKIRPLGAFSSNIKVTGGIDELKIIQSFNYNSLKMNNEATIRPGSILLNTRIIGLKPCDIIPVFAGYEKETCPTGEISMDIHLQAEGMNIDELRSSISVDIHPSTLAGFSLGKSTLTAAIDRRHVSFEGALELSGERYYLSVLGLAGEKAFKLDKLKIKSADLAIVSKGVFGYARDGALNMAYNFESKDLGITSVFLPAIKIGGIVSSTGTLNGTMGSPGISAELNGQDISFSGFGADSIKAKIALKGFKLPPNGTADVVVSGFRSGKTTFDKISVHAQNKGNSERFQLTAEKNPGIKFTAEAGITEKGKGVFLADINKMSVSAGTSTWSNDGDIKIEASKKQVQVQALRMLNGKQSISAKGVMGRVDNMNMKLSVEHADISEINKLAGLDLALGGILSAEIGVEGSYLAPHISGSVDVLGAGLGGISFDRIPVTLTYAEKNLRFEAHVEKDGKTLFLAEGDVPVDLSLGPVKDRILHKGLRVSIKTSGLGLKIIPMLTEQVKSSSGELRADILAEGDPLSPLFKGNIDITGGALTLLATDAEYRDINASIALDGNDIIFRRLTLKSGSGSAEITGKIMLKGFIPTDADLDLECRDFNVMSTRIFTGNIDSKIKIKGLKAAGTLTLTRGAVNIPSQAKAEISDIEYVQAKPGGGTETVPSDTESPELYKLLILDVRVSIPGKAWVYGAGVSAEINGDLNVTKKRDGPMSYSGELDTARGTYKIKERVLTISEGKLLPRGSDFLASLVRAKASCKIGNVSIDVILGGTLDNPIITFQSDPPMERSDIISYLAFGAPSSNLSQSQSSSLQNSSFDILAGLTENDIKGVVNRVVPIDELTLKPSEGSWGVGKNITDKLSAKYEWRSGLDESPQTVLDYRLDRHYSLNSQIGDPKTSGVDLFWKYGY